MYEIKVELVELVAIQNAIGLYAAKTRKRANSWTEAGDSEKASQQWTFYEFLTALAEKAAKAPKAEN